MKAIIFLFMFCALAGSSYAQARIAIVDLRKVFDDYYKTKAADATLKDRANDLQKESKALQDQYQKIAEDYKRALDGANDQAVSADEREKRKKTAETKLIEAKELEQNLAQFDRQSRTTLEEQKRRMRENILAEIRSVVTAKAKSGSFTLVIDSASQSINETPMVLFTNGENDLTTAILSELNARAPQAAREEKK